MLKKSRFNILLKTAKKVIGEKLVVKAEDSQPKGRGIEFLPELYNEWDVSADSFYIEIKQM